MKKFKFSLITLKIWYIEKKYLDNSFHIIYSDIIYIFMGSGK